MVENLDQPVRVHLVLIGVHPEIFCLSEIAQVSRPLLSYVYVPP